MSTPDQRCPQCAALLRGTEQWCLLCHADLRPAPPAPEPADVQADAIARALLGTLDEPDALSPETPLHELIDDPLGGGPAEPAPVPRGKHARVAEVEGVATTRAAAGPNAFAEATDVTDTEVMFALLRAEGRDPVLSRFGGSVESPSVRFGLMVGGAAVIAGLLFGIYSVLGFLFG